MRRRRALHHAQFDSPRGLTLTPDGALLIADRFDQRIRLVRPVSSQARISTIAGSGTECAPQTDACGDGGPASDAHLNIPRATALTPGGGYVIADEGDHRIRAVPSLSPDSTITTVAGTGVPWPEGRWCAEFRMHRNRRCRFVGAQSEGAPR